jgi:hypothetical protein
VPLAARKPVSEYETKEKDSVSRLFQLPSLDKKETWFPTLQKTVWVLSQLHDFVKVVTSLARFDWMLSSSSPLFLKILRMRP